MSGSTSPTPSSHPSSTPQSAPTNDTRTNVVAIVLAIVGLVVVAVVVYTTWRLKRRRSANPSDQLESSKHGIAIDQSHPAAMITPFGSLRDESPRFKHTPGADMRIAVRRPDGAWHFTDPRDPFSPSGVSDIDVLPSPSSSTTMLPPPRRPHRKELEAKAWRDNVNQSRLEYNRDYDVELSPPPPAYGYDYSGHLKD